MAVAIEAEFQLQPAPQPSRQTVRELNALEKARMHELFVASRALVEPIDQEKSVRKIEAVFSGS